MMVPGYQQDGPRSWSASVLTKACTGEPNILWNIHLFDMNIDVCVLSQVLQKLWPGFELGHAQMASGLTESGPSSFACRDGTPDRDILNACKP